MNLQRISVDPTEGWIRIAGPSSEVVQSARDELWIKKEIIPMSTSQLEILKTSETNIILKDDDGIKNISYRYKNIIFI